MTDREQTRRDAELWANAQNAQNDHLTPTARFARKYLALLAELEQAERERDEAKQGWNEAFLQGGRFMERAHAAEARLAKVQRERAEARASRDACLEHRATIQGVIHRAEEAEARLAKVPPLVEALRFWRIKATSEPVPGWTTNAIEKGDAALAVWEHE